MGFTREAFAGGNRSIVRRAPIAGLGPAALAFFCARAPETKGRTLEETEGDLRGNDHARPAAGRGARTS